MYDVIGSLVVRELNFKPKKDLARVFVIIVVLSHAAIVADAG